MYPSAMTDTPPPTVCRHLLRDALARLRSAKGLMRTDVAPMLGCSVQKVSHHETGRTLPGYLELRRYCELYEATEQECELLQEWSKGARRPEWFAEYRPPRRTEPFFGLETAATVVWEAQSDLVPGLLQTSEYARKLFRTFGGQEYSDKWTQLRIRRQERLTSSTDPLKLHAVVSEVALLRCARQPQLDGQGQLEWLLDRMELPSVTLQILPLSGLDTVMGSPIIILGFPAHVGLADTAWTEYHLGGHTWEAPDVVDELKSRWLEAQGAALDENESRAFIRRLLTEMEDG